MSGYFRVERYPPQARVSLGPAGRLRVRGIERALHARIGQHVVERLAHAFEQQVELARGEAQRRREAEHAVAERAEDDAVRIGGRRDLVGHVQCRIEARLVRLVGDQFERAEQADRACVADERMRAQRVEARGKAGRHRLAVREQPAFVIELQHLEADRRAHRMRGIRMPVADRGRLGAAARDPFVDLVGHQHRAHRRIAGGQPLRDGHQVRIDLFGFAGEQRARAAEAGDHLVGDEQDAEAPARVAHRLQPAGRRHDHAAGALHGLAEKRGDVVRAEFSDLRFERGDRRGDQRLRIVAERVAVRVRRRNMVLVRTRQVEMAMERRQRGEAGADRRRAVIAAFQRDHVLFRRAAGCVEIVRDETDRGVDRVRAAKREVHAVQRRRRERGEPLGKLDRRLRAEMEIAGCVRQPGHLVGGGFHDAVAAVADVHAPQARERVEQRMAGGIAQEYALSGFEHGDAARLVRTVIDDGVDQVLTISFDQRGLVHGRRDSRQVSAVRSCYRATRAHAFSICGPKRTHAAFARGASAFSAARPVRPDIGVSSRARDRRRRSSAVPRDGGRGSRAPHRPRCRGASRSRCAA